MNFSFRRWTPFVFFSPGRYIDESDFWDDFDFWRWTAYDYEWTSDKWDGWLDFAQKPRDTVESGRGDCEDYALVALSWAKAKGRKGLGIGFCWDDKPYPTHVIAFDNRRVYTSGHVLPYSPESYIQRSEYTRIVKRYL